MSDFIKPEWSYWISIISLAGIVAMFALLLITRRSGLSESSAGMPAKPTDHSWDEGTLQELNNPLPRWWVIKFFLLCVFAFLYLLVYPGLGTNKGLFAWTSTGQYQSELDAQAARSKAILGKYSAMDFASLSKDAPAHAIGQRLFLNNCAVCHGSNAKGSKSFPNLSDKDWLYGGEPDKIKETITGGRNGIMPAFKTVLSNDQIGAVAHYVRSLSGLPHDAAKVAAGQTAFAANCVACHGSDAKGNQAVGAPNLTDSTWLYGPSIKEITFGVTNGRNNVMPVQTNYLSPEQIHLVAAYVWSLSNEATK